MTKYLLTCMIICSFAIAAEPAGVVEWQKKRDLVTGRFVWQITDHDSASETVYNENQAFTADDRYIVFGSNRSGYPQIYRADLQSGEILAVSDKRIAGRVTIGPEGQHVWYIHDNVLYKTHIESRRDVPVMDFRKHFSDDVQFSRSFTKDGVFTLVYTQSESQKHLYRVNLRTKEIEKVMSKSAFGHPQMCPTNPDLVSFAQRPDTQNDMSLPMEKRTHTWVVNMKTGEHSRILTMPYGFRLTHPTWAADGKGFFFFRKTVPGWLPVTICSQNLDGTGFREYTTHSIIRLGHGVSSADGKWFVSDGQDPHFNPIMLINLITGEETILCWPNSSIYNQHVHPSLSQSGKFVAYTSDISGTSQVYVVPTGID
ncbi:hypothetical protein GF406_14835 [candidate division KSB1 bacterium]|nr:hypothetical protein [candidate division KSB1 bacterium]